jgi:hypothetical protein
VCAAAPADYKVWPAIGVIDTVVSKYADHLRLYRQSIMLERERDEYGRAPYFSLLGRSLV